MKKDEMRKEIETLIGALPYADGPAALLAAVATALLAEEYGVDADAEPVTGFRWEGEDFPDGELADANAQVRDLEESLATMARHAQDHADLAHAEAERARRYSELLTEKDREIARLERENRELAARLDAAREHADHADQAAAVLEGQVAELLPWARAGVRVIGQDYDYTTYAPEILFEDAVDSAVSLLGRIDAGEFGPVPAEVA